MNYFILFLQSNFLELPVYLLFLRKDFSFFNSFALVTCLNAITHPMVFFFIMNLKMSFLFNILASEIFAILTEALSIQAITDEKYLTCLVVSFCANFLSWQVSPMITFALRS